MTPDTPEGNSLAILAVAVGNSRSRLGLFRGADLIESVSAPNPGRSPEEEAGFTDALRTLIANAPDAAEAAAAVVMSSVHRAGGERASTACRAAMPGRGVYAVGRDLPIPVTTSVDEPERVGHDRLMDAIGAYDRAQQACVVVDVGTAVTVDFIDGEGTFHGGVIAPGLAMMLRALHEHTDALPMIAFEPQDPQDGPFGRNTSAAMRLGAAAAIRGLLRECLDTYAERFGAYPQVVATGGDVGVLEATGLVEHMVPDLQLLGIQVCAREALHPDDPDPQS